MNPVNNKLECSEVDNLNSSKTNVFSWGDYLISFHSTNVSSVYLPFRTVRHMVTHCYVPFVQNCATTVHDRPIPTPEVARTSCIQYVMALSVIFSGMVKAKHIVDRLVYSRGQNFSVCLVGNSWVYQVENLFTGRIITRANKELPIEEDCKNILEKVDKSDYINDFFCFSKSLFLKCRQHLPIAPESNAKFISNFENELVNLKYDFNQVTISSLKDELSQNYLKINSENSILYYVLIQKPKFNLISNDAHNVYHTFAIEQFQGPEEIFHRFYHSWENEMTPSEYFIKKNYSDKEEGCMDLVDTLNYLDNVQLILSPQTKYQDRLKLHERCFGFETKKRLPTPIFYDLNKRVLKGFSFRYVSQEFDPRSCVGNFNEFVKTQMASALPSLSLDSLAVPFQTLKIDSVPQQRKLGIPGVFWNNYLIHTIPKGALGHTPFKIVKYMTTACYASFVQAAVKWTSNVVIAKDVVTMGILNLYALSIIFIGMDKVQFLIRCLERESRQTSHVKLVDQTPWEYGIENLFTGSLIRAGEELGDNENWSEVLNKISSPEIEKFMIFIQDFANKFYSHQMSSEDEANEELIRRLKFKLNNLDYDFNKAVFSTLKNDMRLHMTQKINAQSSVVYFVSILTPGEKSYHDYHSFVIEQFLGSSGVLHRLYHSFEMALSDYFRSRNYDEGDEGCLNIDQMMEYLDDVNAIVSPNTNPRDKMMLCEKCFGVAPSYQPPSVFFDPRSRFLKGLSVRYLARPFNPIDCVENFNSFIKVQM